MATMTREQLRAAALALEPVDREALAEELLLSIGEDDREVIDAAWLGEVRSRYEAYRRGEGQARSVDEVVGRLERKARS